MLHADGVLPGGEAGLVSRRGQDGRGRLRRAVDELLTPNGPRRANMAHLREGDYPPPYPNGWYRVANSDEVPAGTVLRRTCVGRDLVVFRGESGGGATVSDAHCPHQGADLGIGGRVEGDCLRCPFHHWQFGVDGKVHHIPDVETLPRIRLRTWPVCERYGMIWVYFDADEPGVEPPYAFADHPGIDSGELVYRGEHRPDDVDMHLVEFAENSVDFQHFAAIHGVMLIPWTTVPVPFVTIQHDPSWELDPEHPHIAYFGDHACLEVFGKVLPQTAADARITFFGPGGAIWFQFQVPEFGDITLFHTHTPVEPLRQEVYFRWYASPKIPKPLVSYVVGNWVSNWRADIEIWENKVYRRKPMLSRADGPVARMRRWYRQFYRDGDDGSGQRPVRLAAAPSIAAADAE